MQVGSQKWLALGLCVSLAGSCFGGEFVQGLPCDVDSECGPELLCLNGFCGGKGSTAVCGNYKVEGDEDCDGNSVDGVECTAECRFPPVCGNGEVEAGEECDDGNTSEIDECTSECTYSPEVPTLELSFEQVKQFKFHWQPVRGVEWYELYERVDEDAEFVQVGGKIDKDANSYSQTVPLHFRVDASYKLVAYRSGKEPAESVVNVTGNLAEAIGYFKASNTDTRDYFGESVALSGDGMTLAVGAPWEDSNGNDQNDNSVVDSGAVYVFTQTDQRWLHQAYVKASNIFTDGRFGTHVALSEDGNTLAALTNAGAVYIFSRVDDTWTEQGHHNTSNMVRQSSLALSGDGNTISVGVQLEDKTGAVYTFKRANGLWALQEDHLTPPATDISQRGIGVALSSDGNTLAVGASEFDTPGTVYIYGWEDNQWMLHDVVEAHPAQFVSTTVALSGDGHTLAIGSDEDSSDVQASAVHVFIRGEDEFWSLQKRINSPNTNDDWDGFGESIALSEDGNTLAIGAPFENSMAVGINPEQKNNLARQSGAAYLFVRAAGGWAQQVFVKGPVTAPYYEFGTRVALSNDGKNLAIGAPGEGSAATSVEGEQVDDSRPRSGAVYVF